MGKIRCMFLALLWKCHIFLVSVFYHITNFGRCFSLIFDYFPSAAKNLPFHAQCKMKPLIAVLYENCLFWKMWKTFDLYFSFPLCLCLLDRGNKILENNFLSVCFLKLSETVLLSSVIIMIFLQICTPDRFSTVLLEHKNFILYHLWSLCLYITQFDWSFLQHHVLYSQSVSNLL